MLSQLIDKHIFPSPVKRHQTTELNHNVTSSIEKPNQFFVFSHPPEISSNFNSQKFQDEYQQPQFVRQSSSKLSEITPGNNVCQECGKSFLKNAHLLRHMNERHSDNRSFVCSQPQCGKTFKRDSHLRRHMISHTHQKKFKCSQCIMAFGYKHHLDRHVKTVHEKALLTCQECGQTFAKKKPFLKHVQKVHSKLIQKTSNSNENKKKNKSSSETRDKKPQVGTDSNGSKTTKTKKIKKLKERKEKSQQNKIQRNQDREQSSASIFGSEESSSSQSDNSSMGQIQQSQNKKNQKKQEIMLFRCVYSDCVSAFGRMHELMRHMKQKHSQYRPDEQKVEKEDEKMI